MRTAENLKKAIKVPGELYPAFSGKNLAGTDVLYDYVINKTQEDINKLVNTKLESIDTRDADFESRLNDIDETVENLELNKGIVVDDFDLSIEDETVKFASRDKTNNYFGYNYISPEYQYNVPYIHDILGINEEINIIQTPTVSIGTLYLDVYYYPKGNQCVAKINYMAPPPRNTPMVGYVTTWDAFGLYKSSSLYNDSEGNLLSRVYYLESSKRLGTIQNTEESVAFQRLSDDSSIEKSCYLNISEITLDSINVFRHNFDLDELVIDFSDIDEYYILKFEGGSFYNGTIIGSNKVYLDLDGIAPTLDWSVFEGNFANYGTIYPTNPHIGQTFFNTNLKKLLVWDGNRWIDSNGKLPIQNSGTTLPTGLTNSDKGTIFYKEGDGLYYWNGSEWKPVGLSGIIKVDELPESGDENIIYFNTSDGIAYVWDDDEWKPLSTPEEIHKGTSAERPTDLTSEDEGYMYYDTTLHKPIFWNGEYWINADGTVVANKSGSIFDLPTNLRYPRDLGYQFYDSENNVLLTWSKDDCGNDVWTDLKGNSRGIINFTRIEPDRLIVSDSSMAGYYIENVSIFNPISVIWVSKNKQFVALNTKSSHILHMTESVYINWTCNGDIYDREYFSDVEGNVNTLSYFRDISTGIVYKYDADQNDLIEVGSSYLTEGSCLQRPTNLTRDSIGKFKYYDTSVNKELVYSLDMCGNDLWLDEDENCYNIINVENILINGFNGINLVYNTTFNNDTLSEYLPGYKFYIYGSGNYFTLSNNISILPTSNEDSLEVTGILYRKWSCLNSNSYNLLSSVYLNQNKRTLIFKCNNKYYRYSSATELSEFNFVTNSN